MRIPIRRQPKLPAPVYQSRVGRWLTQGDSLHEDTHHRESSHPWYSVIWLTGVDYFSTLGYQPGIALLAAGSLSPIAAAILVLVTLFGAVPVYSEVAARSFAGQGSIALLENLLAGWKGKFLVLTLLGFAMTDFVITMTLSAADAATHAIENPILHPYLGDHQMLVTLVLLTVLALIFLRGFKEAIGIASAAAIPYLALNAVVLIRCFWEIAHHPEHLPKWQGMMELRGDPTAIVIASLLVFPKLALGLSGFETGVSVMPLINGGETDRDWNPRSGKPPRGRIANTRKLLVTAALIMSVFLMASSFATTLLITPAEYAAEGPAAGRAIAFLAHRHMGPVFGTVYDISTIVILSLAGASAMAGLMHLIPRYLPRFGMAPQWAALARPLVLVLTAINFIITIAFKANVEAQSGAYATGVLVLILSAAFAATLSLKREGRHLHAFYTGLITLAFAYTLGDNVIERPDGIIIGSLFILGILIVSGLSRGARSIEFRVEKSFFTDAESASLGASLTGKTAYMVPIKTSTPKSRQQKREEIQLYYRVTGPLAFIHVHLVDNRSEFSAPLEISIVREGKDYVVDVFGAIAIANTLAYLSELTDPIGIFLGLTRKNLMRQAFDYLLFGEGETGLMVYTILLQYWEWTPEDDVRPLIFLLSD